MNDEEHEDLYDVRDEIMNDVVVAIDESGKCGGCLMKHLLPAIVGYAIWRLDVHEQKELQDFWTNLLQEALGQAAAIEGQVLQAEIDAEKIIH